MTRNATTDWRLRITACAALAAGAVAAQDAGDGELGPLRAARDALVAAEDFTAALEPATRIVETLEAREDPAVGLERLLLARVHAGLRDFESAETVYLQAIDEVADEEGAASPTLIGAYQGLGRNYLNDRRFDEALIAFEEAQTISRRNEGLFNTDQASIIDDMTLAYLGIGDTVEARDLQLERLDNAIRRFGPDDSRVIPFHTHLGDYLDNSRLRGGAREQYGRALELSDGEFGALSPQSLSLLRRLAQIDLLLDHESDAHTRLATILSEQQATIDPVERAQALIVIADRALVYEGIEAATPSYREAYALLDAREGITASAIFASPQPLNLIPPLSAVDRGARRNPWSWGELTIRFDVSASGRASNVEMESMTPELERVSDDYVRRVREAYFRPRLDDGNPVGTADARYSQNFRYYVRD